MLASAVLGVTLVEDPPIVWLMFGVLSGLAAAYLTSRYPSYALVILVCLAQLYPAVIGQIALLAPKSSALAVSYWKEIVALTLGAMVLARGHRDFSVLDWTVVAFIAVVLFYVFVPAGSINLYIRMVAARADAVYLMLFLVARHLVHHRRTFQWVEVGLLLLGAIFALGAILEHFAPAGWAVLINALLGGLSDPSSVRPTTELIAGSLFVRAGSFMSNPNDLAYFLLIVLGLVIGRIAHRTASWWIVAIAILALAGIAAALTRSALMTVPVMMGVALLVGRRRGILMTVFIAGLFVALPVAASVGLTKRVGLAFQPNDPGTTGHLLHLQQSVALLQTHPMGLGLGTAGEVTQRFWTSGVQIFYNDSWYFQMSTELGILGFLLIIAFLAQLLRELWRRSRGGSQEALGALCALSAVAIGGLVLHTFESAQVAWAVMVLAGLACRSDANAAPQFEVTSHHT
ncbi:MAG: O-antigen ligase family protein [Candidatus Dormibacteria bacterium]